MNESPNKDRLGIHSWIRILQIFYEKCFMLSKDISAKQLQLTQKANYKQENLISESHYKIEVQYLSKFESCTNFNLTEKI